MNKAIYFFDSYAIMEIIKGNEAYLQYRDAIVITTKLNMFEVYYGMLRDKNEEQGELVLKIYRNAIIDYNEEIIKNAAKLRLKLKKRNISMTDCIGYTLAETWGIPFLTGDNAFHDLENVEFVK